MSSLPEHAKAEEALPVGVGTLEERVEQRTRAFRAERDRFRDIVEAAPDAIVLVQSDGRISLVNAQTERLFGYRREELLGRPVEELMPERFRDRHREHRAGYVVAPTLRPMGAGLRLFARRKDGSEFPVEISLSPLETDAGCLVVGAIRDVTERRRLEEERDRLLQSEREKSEQLRIAIQEAHHRIKNNLQAVSNLLYLAGEAVEEPALRDRLRESMERVQAIALVHDLLSHEEGIQTVDLRSVAQRLVPTILQNNGLSLDAVRLTLAVPSTAVPSKIGTTLALVLNELTTNAAKHAFRGRGEGELIVRLTCADEGHLLTVQDDGPGLPPGFDLATHSSLGLLVVQTLVSRDLGGQLTLAGDPGLRAEVWFPTVAARLS